MGVEALGTVIALTEAQRSAARRAAGRRIERKHPQMLRDLRSYYDQPKYRKRWGDHFNARRTEAIRADIISAFKQQYAEFLKEEEDRVRTKP